VTISEVIRQARRRHGLSQAALAFRAGTDQAAVSRIERGEISPTVETVERLLAAMGEQLEIEAKAAPREYDPLHLRASLRRSPEERLRLAISWNRLAGQLAAAGARARSD
jgi:transcriptional regulator with XRE-family HTH domain